MTSGVFGGKICLHNGYIEGSKRFAVPIVTRWRLSWVDIMTIMVVAFNHLIVFIVHFWQFNGRFTLR